MKYVFRVLHSPEYSPDVMFQYLEDQAIQKDKSQIWKCVKAVYDRVFTFFLDLTSAKVNKMLKFYIKAGVR